MTETKQLKQLNAVTKEYYHRRKQKTKETEGKKEKKTNKQTQQICFSSIINRVKEYLDIIVHYITPLGT